MNENINRDVAHEYKGYRIRLFPCKEQEQRMFQYIGASRAVYNIFLDIQIKNYKDGGKRIKEYEMYNMLKKIKQQEEYAWMNKISNKTLQGSVKHIDVALENFFNNGKEFPKFKSKKNSKMCFPVRCDSVYFRNGFYTIEKIGKIKYKSNCQDLDLENLDKFSNGTVTYVKSSGKWILSFSLKREDVKTIDLKENFSIGIDLGVKQLATISYKDQIIVYRNINKDKRVIQLESKLHHIERIVARKYRTNGNYNKTNRFYITKT